MCNYQPLILIKNKKFSKSWVSKLTPKVSKLQETIVWKSVGLKEQFQMALSLRSSCFWDNVLIQLSFHFLTAMSKSWIISFVNILVQKEKLVIKEDEQFIRRFVSSISPETSRQSDWIILNFRFDTSLWLFWGLTFVTLVSFGSVSFWHGFFQSRFLSWYLSFFQLLP